MVQNIASSYDLRTLLPIEELIIDYRSLNPKRLRNELSDCFVEQWKNDRSMDGKLGFYNPTKDYLNLNYLNLDLSYKQLQVQTICTILNKLLVNLELKPAVMVPKETAS